MKRIDDSYIKDSGIGTYPSSSTIVQLREPSSMERGISIVPRMLRDSISEEMVDWAV